MKLILRALISLICGSGFYCALLFSVFRFHPPGWISRTLIWNVIIFSFLGRGEPIGYMPDGAPIYDGSVGFLGFTDESILTGFVIYPVLTFAIISILRSGRGKLD
jgi:hypothetical protein